MKDKPEYFVALFCSPPYPALVNEGLLYLVLEFFTKYKIKAILKNTVFSNVSTLNKQTDDKKMLSKGRMEIMLNK